MKSGNIKQYSHLSQFSTVQQFNETINYVLDNYGDQFTKGELLAFEQLTRFSVKEIGICNARICKLVEAAQVKQGGISRSTFERMLRKAKNLGILSIFNTTREKGGFSHNVYVFHRFDGATNEKLTERKTPKKPTKSTVQNPKTNSKTISVENKINNKDLRPPTLESLDHTYVPSFVPTNFTKAVKPFFNRAKEICELWDRAVIAYRSQKFDEPIEHFAPTIIKAFKETVYQWKRKRIKTGFKQYYYGTTLGMMVVENRRMVASRRCERHWLYG
ncbi:hypothetical protein BKP45_21175 [Anaerobacillus alkalidiazotrophicus]|uniref:Uncharacterized protein n=1 Tax=Anaerobacillus alkalidiazotrophicus TaxID=472963 RepID=A0A1S2LVJ2_9BACI|nr:hypothetical protein [Anaerobacillus alkalidiazotrophicus]OIJ16519.1 hypothetical protein BKP45_21175 [Anaerobacillus alkalidiazotrophicus]